MRKRRPIGLLTAVILSCAMLQGSAFSTFRAGAAQPDAFRVDSKTYSTLAKAYDAVQDGGVIEMIRDYTGTGCEHVGIDSGVIKHYTINGNGYTYSSSSTHALHFHNSDVTVDGMNVRTDGSQTSGPRIEHTSTVVLRNSTWEKTGSAVQKWHTAVIVYGTLILGDGAVVKNNGAAADALSGAFFLEGKKMVRESNGNYADQVDASVIPHLTISGAATVSCSGALFVEAMPAVIRIENGSAVLSSETALRLENAGSSFSFVSGTLQVQGRSVTFPDRDGKSDGRLVGYSLSPGDDIGIHFYVTIGDGATDEYQLQIRLPNGETVTRQLQDGTRKMELDLFPVYRFSCGVRAAEMTREITARVFRNGEEQDSATVSVRDYALALLSDSSKEETVKNLLRAMLHYGAQTQLWFGENIEQLADVGLQEQDFSEVSIPDAAAGTVTGEEYGVSYLGSSLLLKSKTRIRHYFRVSEGIDLSVLTAMCNGKALQIVPCSDPDDCFYIEIAEIRASRLSESYTVKLGGLTINYSAMSYAYAVCTNETAGENLKNLLASMKLYADCAQKHTEETKMKYRILLVSDMHYTVEDPEKYKSEHPTANPSVAAGPLFGRTQREKIDLISEAVKTENQMAKLDAVLVLGDLSLDDYGYRNLPDNYVERFRDECMSSFPCPSYAIAGNHDSYPETEWQKVFGYGRQYSVKVGDRVFIMLDTFRNCPATDASGAGYTPVDTDFLKAELAKYPTEKIFLCTHYIDVAKEQENTEFCRILRENDRIVALFRGHTHMAELMTFAGKPLVDIGGYGYSGQLLNGSYTFGVFSERWAYGYEILEWDDESTHFFHVKPALRYEAQNGTFDVPLTVSGECRLTHDSMTETIRIIAGGNNGSLTTVELDGARAVYANALLPDGGEVIFTPTQPECDEFVAIENHSPFWCRPVFGTDLTNLPERTQALLLRKGSIWHYFLPVCADTWKTLIRSGKGGMEFRMYTDYNGTADCLRQLSWVEARGKDPLKLAHRCAQAAATLLGNGLKLREERIYPDVLEYLGWCSWDAFQIRVNEAGLLEKAAEFREKQIPVKYAIIDDMWADCPALNEIPPETDFGTMVGLMHKTKMRSFEGDPIRFPNGMKHTVEALKQAGLRDVGIWFPTTGYWFGVEPGSEMEREFDADLYTAPDGRRIVKPEAEHTTHFFGTLCDKVRNWGADFVKIDNQGCRQFYRTVGPIGKTARAIQSGIESAVAKHLNGAIINCMGMPSECMFNRPDSAVSRCSDDFMPENRAWFTKHILQCAFNGILQGQFYVNDWDMWWTDDGQARKNSLCRAVSGGPIYVSDKLGRTNPDILRPLCLSDGRILRPDESATPTSDCLTGDPRNSGKAFKIRNRSGNTGILAAFDLDAKEQTVTGSLGASDVGLSDQTRVIVYDWFSKTCSLLEAGERMNFTLSGPDDFRLWWIVPYVSAGVTVLGKTDLFIGCRAMEPIGENCYRVMDGGEIAVASKRTVRAEQNGMILNGDRDGLVYRFRLSEETTEIRFLTE